MKQAAAVAFLLFLATGALSAVPVDRGPAAALQSALVRVEVTRLRPNHSEPWALGRQGRGSGTGFVLEGGGVLTCAHLVSDATFVEVRRAGDPRRFPAEVFHVGHASDLALLRVADPAFLEGVTPLGLGELPLPGAPVSVLGFAGKGEQPAVTAGVVSRLGVTRVAHSLWILSYLQVDAAVNAGNSGGPVLAGGRVVGVVIQGDDDAENVSWAVPAPLLRQFLDDAADGNLDGLPDPGFWVRSFRNPALRRFLGAEEGEGGSLVTEVGAGGSADGVLQPDDLLLAIDGHDVAADGTVELRPGERIDFDFLFHRRQVGERVPVVFRRGGERRTGELRLAPAVPLLRVEYDRRPSYLIVGGLVVHPATYNLALEMAGREEGWVRRFGGYIEDLQSLEREEILYVSQVLADPVNADYEDAADEILVRANGRELVSLADLAAALREPLRGFHRLEFENGFLVVFDAAEEAAARPRILARHGIPSDRSPDLAAAP
ncbi:MAG: S1C family serine protease [Thermoanaerobaculia bacterium]|nr:S1C family serine protease [Thermoanaerobaculia bacterium]